MMSDGNCRNPAAVHAYCDAAVSPPAAARRLSVGLIPNSSSFTLNSLFVFLFLLLLLPALHNFPHYEFRVVCPFEFN